MSMEIKKLNEEERRTCHGHYKNNDLFRQWMPILSEIEGITNMDAISIWYNADAILRQLRSCTEFRDNELEFIHSEIARKVSKEVVSATMAIVLSRLINAAQEGHEEDYIPNDAMSNAILKKHFDDTFFERLMHVFLNRKIGNDGKKVIITPSDPMTQNTSLDDMDDVSKEEMKTYVQRVMEFTHNLNIHFKEKWEGWYTLWMDICMDAELFNLLKEVNPHRNDWNLNQKMICNVLGLCVNKKILDTPINALNKALTTKQVSSYIRNPKDFGGSDSALFKEQCDKIEVMLECLL